MPGLSDKIDGEEKDQSIHGYLETEEWLSPPSKKELLGRGASSKDKT
jgi:hypothetical protein